MTISTLQPREALSGSDHMRIAAKLSALSLAADTTAEREYILSLARKHTRLAEDATGEVVS